MLSFKATDAHARGDTSTSRIRSALVVAAVALLAAACTSGIGTVKGVTSNESPTTRQRIEFQLEEHGYLLSPPTPYGTPTPRQRMDFLLEEHGYSVPAAKE